MRSGSMDFEHVNHEKFVRTYFINPAPHCRWCSRGCMSEKACLMCPNPSPKHIPPIVVFNPEAR